MRMRIASAACNIRLILFQIWKDTLHCFGLSACIDPCDGILVHVAHIAPLIDQLCPDEQIPNRIANMGKLQGIQQLCLTPIHRFKAKFRHTLRPLS